MRDDFAIGLFDMASIKFQEKYILNGTKEEYILPVDLVQDLENCCNDMPVNEFSEQELQLRQELLNKINDLNWNEINNKSRKHLIYENISWIELRNTALKLLNILGYNLDDFDDNGDLIKP